MLRNGKSYASAASSTGSESSYQYPTTITMESTQHQEGGDAVKEESFVVDSEIERLSKANNASVPEAEELRMPGKPEVGVETPIPARLVDAADGIPAKDLSAPDSQHNGSALQLSDDEDPLGERVTRPGYMIGDDGTRHPMARSASANPPEMMEHPYHISGPKLFRDSSFASLLEHDAQPRNEETLEFPNDEFDYGEYVHDMGSAIYSPGTRSLIERIEKREEFEARNEQEIHLMASRGKHRKHRHHRRKDDTAGTAYSSYDAKGKAREPGTRPAETEQIRLDKEFAESEQARIYEEGSKAATNNADLVVEKDRAKAKKKDRKTKSKAKNHRELTQWIEAPYPSPESRVPAASPIRALNQLPSGGYLARAWTGDSDRKRKSSGHKVSRYTKRKLENKEAKMKAWRERSDISEHADDGGRGPPDDSSPSSSSSSNPSSDDDTSTSSESESSEEPDSTSSSSSESNEIHHKSRQRRNKKSKQEGKRRNALAKTIKYPEPAAYDGRAHLETFETFMFEFNSWVEVNDIPEKYQMMAMKRFLTGKAGNHYMTFAAIDLRRWTVDNYLRALFNHCFPIHFRSEMRAKFNRCVQGSRTTREFLRELRTLGNRLPDIGDVQIRLQYWEGSNQYLRVEWAKAGMDPESTTLAELEVAAERFEMAETLKKGEDRRTSKPSKPSSAVEKSEKRAERKKERPRRWQNKQGQKIRWKKSARETGTSDPSPPEKRYAKREKSGDVQEGKGKLSKARKDELRASNKCFHCEQVGHLAAKCPVKKTIRPSVGAISLPSIETLHSSVNAISLFAMSAPTRVVAKRRRPSRQAESGPFGDHSPSSVVVSPPSDSSRSDLISNPAEMLGQPTAAHVAVRFGWELGKKLNQAPAGPESKLIAPEPGQETNRRYTVYVRRNGRSVHVLDSYAKRGREVLIDENVSVDEVAEQILLQQNADFCQGNLNWDYLWPKISERLLATLNDPRSGMAIPSQDTPQFDARRSTYQGHFAVIDLRNIPERKGDPRPQYILPLECLTGPHSIVNCVYWRSAVYDRLRAALYNSAPTATDRLHTNTHIRPWSNNRFAITMSSPQTWWIQDAYTQRSFYIWETLAGDLSFDIGMWFTQEASVYDLNEEEFDTLQGSLWYLMNTDDFNPDLSSTSIFPPPITAKVVGSAGGLEDYHPVETDGPAVPSDDDESSNGERDVYYDTASEIRSRESYRPYVTSTSSLPSPDISDEHPDYSDHSDEIPDLASVSDYSVSEGNEYQEYAEGDFDWTLCDFEGADPYAYYLENEGPNLDLPSHIVGPSALSSSMVSTPNIVSKRRAKKKPALTQSSTNRVERNSARVKDFERIVPHPIIVEVLVNGSPARALVDTGSLADFISTKLVDQLKLPTSILNKPLPVQLATTGSRTKVNCCMDVEFSYQNVRENRRFDVINLDEYDLILGTPFLYQYKVAIGFHPSQVALGTNKAAPIQGMQVSVIPSKAADLLEQQFEILRKQLQEEAKDLCKDITDTPLPPLRAVNHTIPLINEKKIYSYRPARCPDAMKPLWREKKEQYIKSGRWRVCTGSNSSPLLILWKPKPGADGQKRIRTVVDKREQNANTVKLSSPLPDMETMLRNAAKHKYRSLIDGKDAYEQIRVVPEHVHRTLFNTPDGTMESLVLQQGDCNGGATYQSLMNHIFSPYIGVFMDVYLDDVLIYSDTVEDHIKHVRIVLDVLRREKLYLSWEKMKFFARELVLLGHVITDQGIKMDPNKVDAIEKWKVPTSKDLLSGFLGSVGYLANGIKNIRIPMAALTPLTGSKKVFRWGPTEQRAFDTIKSMVSEHRNKYRSDIDDREGAPPINVTCDASLTGAGGHLSQGQDLETAKNIAFWSGKFNSAQQNYPTHERELLAIVESLKRFKHMLYGRRFRIFTDHRALEYLMKQKNLSPRQARWLEFLCELDFEICYLPGKANLLSDALSRMYGNESKGTVRAKSEFVSDLEETNQSLALSYMALRLGEPGTIDTSASVFYRLGLSGISVRSNEENRRLKRPAPKIRDNEGDVSFADNAEPDTDTSEDAMRDNPKPDPEDDDVSETGNDDDASDSPEEMIPARESARTRSGRAIKPKRRRDHDFERLYGNKVRKLNSKPSPRMIGSETTQCADPEVTITRPKKVRLRLRGQEGEGQPKITTDPPTTPESTPPPSGMVNQGSDPNASAEADDNDWEGLGTSIPETEEVPIAPEPMASLISSAEGIDVYAHVRGNYDKDPLFKLVLQSPEQYRNFELDEGLLYLKSDGSRRKLCIPDVTVAKRKLREIIITHAHTILAHLSARKTLYYLREHVWWKGMLTDVTDFCDSCSVCRASKSQTTKPYGLLKTLEIAKRPWQSIGIDFVGPLPSSKTRNGSFDMICVIIDHLTCLVHLVPTDQRYRAKHIAEVVFDSVYKLHGLPERIVSDRDSLFTSIFWSHLHKLMGVELKMSTVYHPQTDGATERVNKTMVQMLRQCVSPNQKDWAMKLPAIEFAINSARSDTTGFSPFFLTYGRVPDPMLWNNSSEYPGVRAFAQRMKDAIIAAHDAIIAARIYQTSYANRHRRPSEFAEGDLVYLSTENLNLPKGRSRKLVPKYIGPYRVKSVKSPGASYELDLPGELRRRGIHPVFHASLLRPHIPNDDRRFPGRDVRQLSAFESAPKEYLVDKIVSHYGKGKEALFKVAWTSGDHTWMTHRDVIKTDILRPYYEALGIDNIDSLPNGKSGAPNDVELHCGAMKLWNITYWLSSRSNKLQPVNNPLSSHHNSTTKLESSDMSFQFTHEELNDFFAYDANLAIRLVAEDEGKTFTRIIPKPAGYDDWLAKPGAISVSKWISEKRSQKELDVNEIGRKMIKRSLFQNMAKGASNNTSRARSSISRAMAFKNSVKNKYDRPGTPYPKVNIAKDSGGTSQYANMGGPPPTPIPDAASSQSFTTVAATDYNDVFSANLRLRREVEELKARELFIAQSGGASNVSTPASELNLDIEGLNVDETPIMSPIPERGFHTNGEMSMMNMN